MYTVITVDDNPWILNDIRRTFDFEKNGFRIAGEYTSAEEALPVILETKPDLIISDIRMEEMSGLDMARHCRENGLESIIVLLSGYERFDYAQEALRYDVFEYLLKPIDDAQVQALMTRILEKMKQRTRKEKTETATSPGDPFSRIPAYMEAHYNEEITLNDIAAYAFLNRTYVSELFPRKTGMSFTRYRNTLRIRHACEMIEKDSGSLTEIALAVGYDNLSRFSRVFRQIRGISPQQYRKEHTARKYAGETDKRSEI